VLSVSTSDVVVDVASFVSDIAVVVLTVVTVALDRIRATTSLSPMSSIAVTTVSLLLILLWRDDDDDDDDEEDGCSVEDVDVEESVVGVQETALVVKQDDSTTIF
jgi:hypothetical protein